MRDDSIVLVRHNYIAGWYLPGGGVKANESLTEAVRREVAEEIGAELGDLKLFGVYSSFQEGRSDHVTVFLCTDFTCSPKPHPEIAQVQVFLIDALPDDVSPGTGRRIEECRRGKLPVVGTW